MKKVTNKELDSLYWMEAEIENIIESCTGDDYVKEAKAQLVLLDSLREKIIEDRIRKKLAAAKRKIK